MKNCNGDPQELKNYIINQEGYVIKRDMSTARNLLSATGLLLCTGKQFRAPQSTKMLKIVPRYFFL